MTNIETAALFAGVAVVALTLAFAFFMSGVRYYKTTTRTVTKHVDIDISVIQGDDGVYEVTANVYVENAHYLRLTPVRCVHHAHSTHIGVDVEFEHESRL